MHVDVIASHRHYLAHVSPIFDELPDELKGEVFTGWSDKGASRISDARRRHNMILGSSVTDVRRGEGRGILCEHGIGQTYSGSPEGKRNPSYAGGSGRSDVRLFLHPNEHSAKHDRTRYPKAQVEIIGSPYLAELQQIPPPANTKPVVAVTTHSNVNVCAEAGSAWGAYRAAFGDLAKRDDLEVIGTAHPRSFLSLRPHYQSLGIEPVETLEEIVARADCMIFDNTSAGFLFAGLGRPVVVLDAPWWDRNVNHGLRFWDCADIGPRICASQDTAQTATALSTAVDEALTLFPWPGAEERLASIFPPIAEPAKHAATVIADHMAAL